MTFLINQAIFILLNTLNAGRDAIRIKQDKTINHFQNGLFYLIAVAIFVIVFRMPWYDLLIFALSCFCNRQLFFDIPLNLLRKLRWDYVSVTPTSWFDKMEIRIWGQDGKKPNYFYGAIWTLTILVNLIFSL